jgi:hypothetical protein
MEEDSETSVSEAAESSSEDSQTPVRRCSGEVVEGMVRWVREEEAELELELAERVLGWEAEKDADAAAEVKEESTLGRWGSGATVVSMVSQWSSTGLTLRSRSPRPSTVLTGLQDSRKELEGSGPSAMVRRPIRRSGGSPTGLGSVASSSLSMSMRSGRLRDLRTGGSGVKPCDGL